VNLVVSMKNELGKPTGGGYARGGGFTRRFPALPLVVC
jgi:hypothetical protein